MDQKIIRTEFLEIVDAAGTPRGRFGAGVDGTVNFSLLDRSGRGAAVLGVDPEGSPYIILSDTDDMPRLTVGVDAEGPSVSLFAKGRNAPALLDFRVGSDGSSQVIVRNTGERRILLDASDNGLALQLAGDPDSQAVTISCGEDGGAFVSIGGPDTVSAEIAADPDGSARLSMMGTTSGQALLAAGHDGAALYLRSHGKLRIVASLDADGSPTLMLCASDGTPRVSAYLNEHEVPVLSWRNEDGESQTIGPDNL